MTDKIGFSILLMGIGLFGFVLLGFFGNLTRFPLALILLTTSSYAFGLGFKDLLWQVWKPKPSNSDYPLTCTGCGKPITKKKAKMYGDRCEECSDVS